MYGTPPTIFVGKSWPRIFKKSSIMIKEIDRFATTIQVTKTRSCMF